MLFFIFFHFLVIDSISISQTAVRERLRSVALLNSFMFNGVYFSQDFLKERIFSFSLRTSWAIPLKTADSYLVWTCFAYNEYHLRSIGILADAGEVLKFFALLLQDENRFYPKYGQLREKCSKERFLRLSSREPYKGIYQGLLAQIKNPFLYQFSA